MGILKVVWVWGDSVCDMTVGWLFGVLSIWYNCFDIVLFLLQLLLGWSKLWEIIILIH